MKIKLPPEEVKDSGIVKVTRLWTKFEFQKPDVREQEDEFSAECLMWDLVFFHNDSYVMLHYALIETEEFVK